MNVYRVCYDQPGFGPYSTLVAAETYQEAVDAWKRWRDVQGYSYVPQPSSVHLEGECVVAAALKTNRDEP